MKMPTKIGNFLSDWQAKPTAAGGEPAPLTKNASSVPPPAFSMASGLPASQLSQAPHDSRSIGPNTGAANIGRSSGPDHEFMAEPLTEAAASRATHASGDNADTSRLRDSVLAEAALTDPDVGYAIFTEDGACIEISDAFMDITEIPDASRQTLKSYESLLEAVGQEVNSGSEDIQASAAQDPESRSRTSSERGRRRSQWDTRLKPEKTLRFKNRYVPSGYLVTAVTDVTATIERDRVTRLGLEMRTSGFWSYHFATKTSVWSDYLREKLGAKHANYMDTDNIVELVHRADAAWVKTAFINAVKTGRRLDIKFQLNLDTEEETHIRMVGQTEYSALSGKPEVFIAYVTDITEGKKRAKELQNTKELSQHRSNFLARMSHEIKTPLNAIVSMTESLREEIDNEDAKETAQYIYDAAENLDTILRQTLEHESLTTTTITLDEDTVNIADLARSAVAIWKKTCDNKGVKLSLRVSPDLPQEIILDRSRFRQCLTNLLSNAVKFTSKGAINVVLGSTGQTTDPTKLVIGVKDTGIGMSGKAISKIFKPFQQADPSIRTRFGGSGLGMSITHHIISAMNGEIKIKSVEGSGTTIAITLPLRLPNSARASTSSNAEPPTMPKPQPQSQPSGENRSSVRPQTPNIITPELESFHAPSQPALKTAPTEQPDLPRTGFENFSVLVVEDNPINQAVVRKLLTSHVKSLTFAFHGEEALECLHAAPFDVILMDIHMPVKDGIETTLEIRNSSDPWANTAIIALTADPDFQQKRVCRNIGMNDALSKPIRRQDLLDMFQKIVDERRKADAGPLAKQA